MADYGRKVWNLIKEVGIHSGAQPLGEAMSSGVTVPAKIKSRHTANGILKQAGIDYKFGAPSKQGK